MLYSPPPIPSPDKNPSSDTPEDQRRRRHENIFLGILFIIPLTILVVGILSIEGVLDIH